MLSLWSYGSYLWSAEALTSSNFFGVLCQFGDPQGSSKLAESYSLKYDSYYIISVDGRGIAAYCA